MHLDALSSWFWSPCHEQHFGKSVIKYSSLMTQLPQHIGMMSPAPATSKDGSNKKITTRSSLNPHDPCTTIKRVYESGLGYWLNVTPEGSSRPSEQVVSTSTYHCSYRQKNIINEKSQHKFSPNIRPLLMPMQQGI